MIVRTARSAAALAVATLLAAVTALLVLPGIAHAKDLNCRDFTYQEQAQDVLDALGRALRQRAAERRVVEHPKRRDGPHRALFGVTMARRSIRE